MAVYLSFRYVSKAAIRSHTDSAVYLMGIFTPFINSHRLILINHELIPNNTVPFTYFVSISYIKTSVPFLNISIYSL